MSEHKRKQLARQAQTEAGVLDDGTYQLIASWALLPRSLRLWRQNFTTCLFFFILPGLVSLLGQIVIGNLSKPDLTNPRTFIGIGIMLLGLLWQYINVPAGIFYMPLRATLGERPGIWQSYKSAIGFLPRLTGLFILLILIIVLGFVCFIVPGIKAARRYVLSPFYLIENHFGIREAMDMSAADSKPAAGAIRGTIGVYSTIAFASLAVGLVFRPYGSVVSVILGSLFNFGFALRYRSIIDAKQQAALLRNRRGKI